MRLLERLKGRRWGGRLEGRKFIRRVIDTMGRQLHREVLRRRRRRQTHEADFGEGAL